jgi:nicotinamidase-related amidase
MITTLDKNTALVLIDLQKGIAQYPTVHPMKDVIANAAKLVAAFHNSGLPVVAVNADPRKFKAVRKEPSKQSMPNIQDEWLEIVEELGTRPDDIFVTKASWGVFGTTDLDEKLKALGVTGIVLGGVSTSIGVDTTAREANAKGYNVTFVTDTMTDTSIEAHEHSLKSIFPRIGEIGTTEDVLKLL